MPSAGQMRAARELGALTRAEEASRPGRNPPPKELHVWQTLLLGSDEPLELPAYVFDKLKAVLPGACEQAMARHASVSGSDDPHENLTQVIASGDLAEELGHALAGAFGIVEQQGSTRQDAADESASRSVAAEAHPAQKSESGDQTYDLEGVVVEALGVFHQLVSARPDGAELILRYFPRSLCIQELIAPGAADATLLKVALLLLWIGRHQPDGRLPEVPAGLYAAALGLPDPDTRGARRVREAQKRLADLNLICRRSRRPRATELRLINSLGEPLPRHDRHDARVPPTLFTSGWIAALGGPALVVLVHIAGQRRGNDRDRQPGATELRRRSRLSKAAWYFGIDELLNYELITRQQSEQGRSVDRYFTRHRYEISREGLGRDASQRRVYEWRTRRAGS